ncbi:hypothetical protein GCM10007425_31310 [Lysinibacillus alkalisoli]|uniref:Uncharacterized protein n=1 Tax=Lysinibacillus alkalisoli TaxID=1911548 RepID=A0A917LK43_9BACI|nr:hypothetical protein GCM10007425_31310 [Lysinibacillus alkalisoli]
MGDTQHVNQGDIYISNKGQGLEKFIKMIQLLSTDTHKYQVALNFINLQLS